MVEYAIAGMDNQLFVSTYMLQLQDKGVLEKYLMDEMEKEVLHDRICDRCQTSGTVEKQTVTSRKNGIYRGT